MYNHTYLSTYILLVIVLTVDPLIIVTESAKSTHVRMNTHELKSISLCKLIAMYVHLMSLLASVLFWRVFCHETHE